VTSFSTARTTPSFTRRPIAVLQDKIRRMRWEAEEIGVVTPHYRLLCMHIRLGIIVHPVIEVRDKTPFQGNAQVKRHCYRGRSQYQWKSVHIRSTHIAFGVGKTMVQGKRTEI
jgi:hypothetical protein